MFKNWIKGIVNDVVADKDKIISLKSEIGKLKEELEDLKLKKKIELRDIEHMIKVKEEKLVIEGEKNAVKLEREYQVKEMKLKTEQHDKIMGMLEKGKGEMQEIYKEIMARLPNVNVDIKRR